jgi:Fe2+ or Zn2+ uptake regulation protein
MRMTKHRSEILHLLEHSSEALSAAQLHTHLPHINLVTIYRTLEQLVTAGKAKKLSFGEQEALYEVQAEPHHHAICTICDEVIHFTFADKELIEEFALPRFSISYIEVTVRGTCHRHRLEKQPRPKAEQKK